MSNNIVQLVDKEGNNIFPVAGSMAGDSITTQMLKDDAVTNDKIADGAVTESKIYSTTLATSSVSLSSGYSIVPGTLATKKGGVVYLNKNLQVPAITSADNQTNAFTLPSGFRPTDVMNFMAFGGVGNIARVRIDTSGTVRVSKVSSDIPANTYVGLSALSYMAAE